MMRKRSAPRGRIASPSRIPACPADRYCNAVVTSAMIGRIPVVRGLVRA